MANNDRQYSCEFFPPRTEKGRESWREALTGLVSLKPAYFSCTYGAGGTTQEGTADTLKEILAAGFPAAAHITCIGSTEDKIRDLLGQYKEMGVNRLVALRGDLPEGMADPGVFRYAEKLIAFIRKETGDAFHIEVAAYPEKHPQAASLQQDMENFRKKAAAGADSAITQYFFNTDAYFRFVDSLQDMGVDIPIVPGIMPITNYKQIVRFSDACGAEIPRWILTRLEGYDDDLDSIRAFGLDVVTAMCERLLDQGVPGLHFYTLNRAEPTATIWRNLGLT
ncbi:MAG: 5,10-methylenetetrahydrofolate reductase [Acidithiobacillales bacterium SG8_45]|jgi:methylenetetrahydrofolate reductase (NADPH)|nr:MAG: 5,10-methylenetetrahydrofolate reductase [Acidithiobacillales bacterium SG8_45]